MPSFGEQAESFPVRKKTSTELFDSDQPNNSLLASMHDNDPI
jgi:hypothetical protein